MLNPKLPIGKAIATWSNLKLGLELSLSLDFIFTKELVIAMENAVSLMDA
ncbi:hypothetical protein JBKA6_1342 [Ichthyobacterium seriolicida]|uniref:Uncharacterized protein n=1 Tax=Ichthyobacterium seriolicida TaxID=242600 RepID=A0A1J1EBP1_9FLAO|nr:hypothetical protein JBKA6_1342 [Ichthyobacterium seriolicida]